MKYFTDNVIIDESTSRNFKFNMSLLKYIDIGPIKIISCQQIQ